MDRFPIQRIEGNCFTQDQYQLQIAYKVFEAAWKMDVPNLEPVQVSHFQW